MKKTITILLTLTIITQNLFAQTKPDKSIAITIYNDNFAVVKDTRLIEFKQGKNKVLFSNVAALIDPTSVIFKTVGSNDEITILEQNYNYDLVSFDALLKRYIDQDVTIYTKGSGSDSGSVVEGKLLSYVGNELVIETDDGLSVTNRSNVANISLKNLPGNLVTKPTLLWLANSNTASNELCQTTYTTGGIGWKSDYLAILNADENAIELSGWVTINNKSGGSYKDAKIKLIAGDVRRVKSADYRQRRNMVYAASDSIGSFQEKAFMEYHMYSLARESTIENNQIKQIQFIKPTSSIATNKIYVYEVSQYPYLTKGDKVKTKFEFENTKENSLGIALPKGKIRVFKRDDADGGLEFVGEDSIDHTARKEKVSLYIGDAFDIVPEMKITKAKHGNNYSRVTREITLKNRKDSAVTVYVDEKVSKNQNLTIKEASAKYEMIDAYTARFNVKIDADSTATISYQVNTTW